MGSSKKQTIGYRYFMGLHMGLCHGPVDSILEIRSGDRTAWKGAVNASGQIYIEAPSLFGGDEREGGIQGTLDVMMGEATQAPNDYLALQQGTPQPAYRGLLSVVFRGPGANNRAGIEVTSPLLVWAAGGSFTLPVTQTGSFFFNALVSRLSTGRLTGLLAANNPYIKPWAFLVRRIAAGWATAVFNPTKAAITVSGDVAAMNPAHIVYECLTNPEWGMGYPAGQLDLPSFTAASDTFHTEGLGLCMAWQQQDTIQSFIQLVMDHAGGMLTQDRRTGLFKLRAIRGDYTLASLPTFGSETGNVLEVSRIERATSTEAVNEITVSYVDATTGKDGSVTVQNLASIQAQGGVVPESRQYPGLPNADLALRTALRDLRGATSGLARVTMTVNRDGWDLEPGDVIRFQWLPAGIQEMALRVLAVDYGDLTDGAIGLDCIEDVFSLPATSYVTPQESLWTSPEYAPQPSPFIAAFEAPYRELVQTLGPAAQSIGATDCYLGVATVKPAGITNGYALQTRAGAAAFADAGNGDWCPSTTLSSSIGPATTALPINASPDLALVNVGELAMIGTGTAAEMVRVDAVNPDTSAVTVARGCLDTVPRSHASGTRVLFLDQYAATDGVLYATGEAVQGRALTRGSTGLLDPVLAPVGTVTMAGRASRPYPPGNFRLNGAAYPASITGALTVSWAHRDRLLQDDQLVDTTAASIGPEVGTTYTLNLYDETNTLRRTYAGLSGTSQLWDTEEADCGLFSVSPTPPGPEAAGIRDNCVYYYPLSETTGTVARDVQVTNRIDATYTGVTLSQAAIRTGGTPSVLVDRTDRIVGNSQPTELLANGTYSMAGWFRFNAWSSTYNTLCILLATGETEPTNYRTLVYVDAARRLVYSHEYGAGINEEVTATGMAALALNTNYHLAVTVDEPTKTVRFYVNGALVDTRTFVNNLSGGTDAAVRLVLAAGGLTGGSATVLNGHVQDVLFTTDVLTAAEIAWLWNSGSGRSVLDTIGSIPRLNTQLRAELFAVRGGVESLQRHDLTVPRV